MAVGVGYLPTSEGRAALQHAIHECTVHQDDLVVVVSEEATRHDDWAADLARAREFLGTGDLTVRSHADSQDAGAELVDLSYEDDVRLLVIGLRRRSPVGKLVMGSTSQRVLLDARCPVTAVKPPVSPAG